ncbi:MAG: SEC59/DGK1/VTE5 family protein [Nitrospinota bacterium]|nr:SEC59/DGK1/VTE5 family protein [Nitrospinota bacterium]
MSDIMENTVEPTTDSHLPRKSFHILAASIIPVIYYTQWLSWEVSAALVVAAMVIWVGADLFRLYNPAFNQFAMKVIGPLLKTKEATQITSSSYILIASSFAILLLPWQIACASLFFIALGDPAAAVVGKLFGSIRFGNDKSLEGSVAMFVVCLWTGIYITKSVEIALVGALVAALTELYSFGLDDNLAVPIFSGLAMAAVLASL